MTTSADSFATELLSSISPNGALAEIAVQHAADEFDASTKHFQADELALQHMREPSLLTRIIDGFAEFEPVIALGEGPIETWAIPLLAGLLGGPFAGVLSFGLLIACKVAFYALKKWDESRLAAIAARGNL